MKIKTKNKKHALNKEQDNQHNNKIIVPDNIAIDIRDLNFYYKKGKKHIIKGISLQINKKCVTALIGPSGCGKSTLLRTLNRLNDLIPNIKITGKVIIRNKNIYSSNQNLITLRTNVGMVFQKPNPFPMSIYDNVVFGPRSQGVKNKTILNQIVKESLTKAALWHEVKDNLKDSALGLSGGQQQRLCIARAIALKPKILLMDEPTASLDPVSTLKIETLIRNLRKDFTIILVTHQMQQAARVADYTAFLLEGKLIEYSKTKELFSKPKDKKTENYITGRFN